MTKPIVVEGKVCTIPHSGITIRSIMAACAASYKSGSRYYDIKLGTMHIGTLSIKNNFKEGEKPR